METIIHYIEEDIKKAKARLEAFEQEDNKEATAFNKGQITALQTVLFDIEINKLTTK